MSGALQRGALPLLLLSALGCGAPPAGPAPAPAPAETRPGEAPPEDAAPEERGPPAEPPRYAPLSEPLLEGVHALPALRLALVPLGDTGPALAPERGDPGSSFEVGPAGPLLLAGYRLISPPRPGELLRRPPSAGLSAFAREPSGGLVLVSGDELGVRDQGGFRPLLSLPGPGFHVACGADGAIYLATPQAAEGPGRVSLLRGRSAATLLEHPRRIHAICPTPEGVLVAVYGGVLEVTPDRPLRVVLDQPTLDPVGLALDPAGQAVFVSDERQVLAVVDGVGLPLLTGMGGPLRARREEGGTALYLLDCRRRLLLRISGLGWLGA